MNLRSIPLNPRSMAVAARLTAAAAALAIAASCASAQAPAPAPAGSITVKLIAFNDYHGNLQSPGSFGVNTVTPAAQRPAVGGAEFLAAAVARLKAQNPLNAVVGAGDFIGASPLISALFFDEPAIETLNHVGVDFSSVGNHEFDKGKEELKRLQNGGCKLTERRARPEQLQGPGLAHARHVRRRRLQVPLGQRVRDHHRPHAVCRPTASRASMASRSPSSA